MRQYQTPTKMADTQNLVDQLSALTVLEIADLVKQLEEKWGVSAAAPVAVAAAGAPAGGPALPAEEKTAFDVILKEAGPNKIAVIKEVRAASRASVWPKQSSRRERAQDPQGGYRQGRGRRNQEKDRGRWRQGRNQIISPSWRVRDAGQKNCFLACVPGTRFTINNSADSRLAFCTVRKIA